MNSKTIILLTLPLLFCACGVKGPPVAPPGSGIPSYQDKFLGNQEDLGLDEDKENEDKKKKTDQEVGQ